MGGGAVGVFSRVWRRLAGWRGSALVGGAQRATLAADSPQAPAPVAEPPLENLLAAARLADEALSEDDALDALEQVGLAGREDLACKYLSQGQKRRVALARLVKEKRLLWILDEPFVALDLAAVDWLAGIISAHLQRGGLAVMTTHQLVDIPAGTVRELRLS